MPDGKPIIRNNYSIGQVLEKYDAGVRTEEIVYLKECVEEYRESKEKRISELASELFSQIPSSDRAETMKWIDQNVEDELKAYVRMKYLGTLKDGDVLKKNHARYKTVSDIGVVVEEADRDAKITELLEYWKNQGSLVKDCLDKNGTAGKLGIFESHAHYFLEQYKGCMDELLKIMYDAGVRHIVAPAIEYMSNFHMKEAFKDDGYGFVHVSYGTCHPKYLWKELDRWDEDRWNEFRGLLESGSSVAVGEMGLDYSYPEFDAEHREFQKDFFIRSIEEANRAGLPAILHIRSADFVYGCPYDADMDAVEILKEHPVAKGAVAHCFGGTPETMRRYLNAGVTYFGIGGRVTYGESGLCEAVKEMPLESLLLETDSPYIKVNGDSRPNTSLAIYDIARKVADIRGCNIEKILEATYENGLRFFGIKE